MRPEVKHLSYVQPGVFAEHLNGSTYDTVFEAVSRHLPRGSRVLDVGSGRGELLKRLSDNGYVVTGCDMDDQCVALGSAYGDVRKLAVEDISPEKFDGKFDCVVMSHVLEHIENPKDALRRISAVLDGFMVISVPNPYYLPNMRAALFRREVSYVNTGHLHTWDWSHFKTFLEAGCGHEVVEWFYDAVPLPMSHRIRGPLHKVGALSLIENGMMKSLLPRFCRSVTAVTRPGS